MTQYSFLLGRRTAPPQDKRPREYKRREGEAGWMRRWDSSKRHSFESEAEVDRGADLPGKGAGGGAACVYVFLQPPRSGLFSPPRAILLLSAPFVGTLHVVAKQRPGMGEVLLLHLHLCGRLQQK